MLLGCAVVAAGCTSSPLDAIVQDVEVDPPPPTPGSESCKSGLAQALFPNGYYIRLRAHESQRCIGFGGPTTVVNTPAQLTSMVTDCEQGIAWQITNTIGGTVELRSFTTGDALDVQMALVAEGTRVILYDPQMLPHQRFYFVPRSTSRVFSLQASHATIEPRCVAEREDTTQIFACSGMDATQGWELVPESCFH